MPHTDLHRVGCTNNRCMRVLPSAQAKKNQKIVVGDQSGAVICFKYKLKENNIDIMFHETKQEGITALTLDKDDIWLAFGQNIEAMKKRGKQFYSFKQSLNEDVTSIRAQVSGDGKDNAQTTLWCCGEFVYNCYVNKQDKHFYMSNDTINDILIVDLGLTELCAVIACKDKCVRILHSSNLLFEAETDDSVTCLHQILNKTSSSSYEYPPASPQQKHQAKVQIVFGLENGSIGQLFLSGDNAVGGWVLEDKNEGRVNCLASYDFSGDDYAELIVGRDNGHLDVYQWNPNGKPFILANEQVNESITSVDTGYVTGITDQDIIISTYSGKIVAFHCDPDQHFLAWEANEFNEALRFGNNNGTDINGNSSAMHTALRMKRSEFESMKQALVNEIRDIKQEFEHKKLKYQEKSRELIAVTTQFQLKNSLKLLDSEACYLLTLEIGIPIEFVAIKSTVGVMSLDVNSNYGIKTQHKTIEQPTGNNDANKSSSLPNSADFETKSNEFETRVSDNASTPLLLLLNNRQTSSNNCFVFHAESATDLTRNRGGVSGSNSNTTSADINIAALKGERITRFTWKFRVLEGQQGDMTCFISSNRIPKTCQSVTLPIHSLSLHSSIFEIPEEILKDKNRPWNTLNMSGDWTVRAFNSWIGQCVPEVPTRVDQAAAAENGVTLNWISTFLQSYLTVTFNKGNAVFKSDNVSAIAILQEYLARYAIENRITLYSIQASCEGSAAMHFLNLIRKNLVQLKKVFDQYSLISSLKEIESHESNSDEIACLNEEYKHILQNSEKIEQDFQASPKQLDFVKTTIWFAMKHYCKLRNINLSENQRTELIKAIDSCEYHNIAAQLKTFMR